MKVVHPTGIRVATLTGAVINLVANEVRELPEHLAVLALGNGAHIVGSDDEPQVAAPQAAAPTPTVEVPHTPAPPVVISDHDRLVKIMKDLVTAGDTANFRADGQPKNAILNQLFGKVVSADLREAAWAEATKVL